MRKLLYVVNLQHTDIYRTTQATVKLVIADTYTPERGMIYYWIVPFCTFSKHFSENDFNLKKICPSILTS